MDTAEILYDAFKESFIQARRLYRVTITIALLTLMIILLVVRDGVILNTSEPKMVRYISELSEVDKQLTIHESASFSSSGAYKKNKKQWQKAKQSVQGWSKNFPARKKMQTKYQALLKEYSYNHEKVMGRLKIDGEPGLKLYQKLQALMLNEAKTKAQFEIAKKQREKLKQQFSKNQASQSYALTVQKTDINKKMKQLKSDLDRIQHDQTRLPWLGLRVNPRDLLTLLPLILLALFHVLFDSFDELLSIMRKPALKAQLEALRAYPVPAFLQRRTVFSWMTLVLLYGFIPIIQVVAVIMIYRYQIGFLGFSADTWPIAVGIGSVAMLLSLTHPVMLLRKHHDILLSRVAKNTEDKVELGS